MRYILLLRCHASHGGRVSARFPTEACVARPSAFCLKTIDFVPHRFENRGFYEFRRQLTYKTELYGSKLIIADRFFPSSKLCPQCRHKKDKLPLSVRVYQCDNHNCDPIADRDYSASLNLPLVS